MQYLPIVLIVSSDPDRRNRIASGLEDEGYLLLTAPNALVAVEVAYHNRLALILLDAKADLTESIVFCQHWVAKRDLHYIPLLVIDGEASETAMATRSSMQTSFDEFGIRPEQRLPEPWSWIGLRTRVRSALAATHWGQRLESAVLQQRHNRPDDDNRVLVAGDLRIDRDRREVTRRQRSIPITKPRLFDLLVYLVNNQGLALTKGRILAHVWGYVPENPITLAVHIRWLRELLEDDPSHPRLIRTVVRVGYRFVAASASDGAHTALAQDDKPC
jgi:DNA-binding response OmpR family regulator